MKSLVLRGVVYQFNMFSKRFLFLKNPIRIHHPEEIDRLFVTCCVLHNIILEYDGYDNWEEAMLENDEEVERFRRELHWKNFGC